jgi:hypothetical protein
MTGTRAQSAMGLGVSAPRTVASGSDELADTDAGNPSRLGRNPKVCPHPFCAHSCGLDSSPRAACIIARDSR